MGYKLEDNKIVKDPEYADLVNDVFDYFELHNNKCATVNYINDKYNKHYHYNSIVRMLSNTLFKGEYNGIEGFCEPYLNKDRFDKIQGLLGRNIKVRHNERVYTYSGLLICAECGCSLAGSTHNYTLADGTKKSKKSYRCNQYYLRKMCTHKKLLNENVIDKFIVANLSKELEKYKVSYEIKAKSTDNTAKRKKLERKIARLKDLYINELITLDEYRADLSRFNAELDKIPTDDTKTDLRTIQTLLNMDIESLWDELSCEERQVLMRSVVKRIKVDAENKMSLEFI